MTKIVDDKTAAIVKGATLAIVNITNVKQRIDDISKDIIKVRVLLELTGQLCKKHGLVEAGQAVIDLSEKMTLPSYPAFEHIDNAASMLMNAATRDNK